MNTYFDGEPFDSSDLTNVSLSLEQNERKSLFEGQIDSVDILGLFAAQVERTPNALAMISGSQWLTYKELNQRANKVAHYLQSLGIKSEMRVGICVERSLELSIGILGILKAGGTYVPFEPLSAQDRLSFVLKDAQVSVLLTQEHLLSSFSGCDVQMVLLDKHWETISSESVNDPITSTHRQNSAYIIYTSGSSGKPKGVVITRQALTNHCIAIMNHYHLKPSDRILQFASPSFDVAAEELFPTWASGASSILRSEQILTSAKHFLRFVVDEKVTVLNLPSSYWYTWITELVNMGARLPSTLRLVIVGSETVLTKHAITWQKLTDGAIDLYNAYGPTETTITATVYGPVGSSLPQGSPSVPIGLPLTNVQTYILDSHLEPASPGIPGELYIGGDGLARGYLNQPGLTAEVFIPHPFSTQPGARLYKTGDMVRSLPDGNIEFLGRLDQQVKIRGFRIELGEIEASLRLHPGVHEVIVAAREDFPGEKHLVAYIVGSQEQGPFIGELRAFLQGNLPAYMIPNTFVFLETFPLTSGGKVDRQALPAPDTIRPALEGTFVAARTQIEEKLAIIWCEVLRVDQVGIYDHFFDLGGHSLAATRIISRILGAFHVELSFRHFFHAPTVAGLAEIIEGERFNQRESLVSPIQSISRQERLPLSFAQERVWFLQQFDLSSVAYTAPSIFRLTGSLKREALEQSINELTRRHEILRTTFPPMNGQPVQLIHSPSPLRLPLIDLQHVVNQENELEHLIYEELRKPFDLTTLPLLRWKLFQLDIHEYVLVLVEHHLIHDGWSTNVLIRDLFEYYKAFSTGKALSLSESPIQFADFAYWQRQWIQSDAAAIQLAYWKKKLEGSSPLLPLPLDRPRPTVPSFRGSARRVQIPAFLYQSLETLIHREEVTPFMALLTVFLVFLYRSTRQEDLCVGSGIANRRLHETEGLLGMIINTIVVRTSLSGTQTFRELLGRVRETVLEVSEYQDFPFDKIVEALHPVRDLSYNPLFQVFFGLHDAPMPELEVPDLAIRLLEAPGNGSAKFDLGIIVIPRPERQDGWNPLLGTEGITMIWEYSTDLFDATTIDLMTKHYQILLESIVNDPEQRISDLPILTNSERQQLLIDWNDTQRDFPRKKRMHELFEEQVAGNPQAVAVVYEEEQLTYEELNQQANQLAHYLRRLGVRSGAMVGVCMERSTEAIVAIIAILKAGGGLCALGSTLSTTTISIYA